MLGNAGIYAVKKRKKPVQKPKKIPGSDGSKSNPSKRHRDRLNGELDRLTGLLPFPEDVHTRLDKLSVLRLSVGYLKVKSFFKATMKKNCGMFSGGSMLSMNGLNGVDPSTFSEGDVLLQALNGFVLVVSAEGHVFYSSPTIQDYLGFHQSDVIHQSVFELIHTDDRALFRRQLHFSLNPNPFSADQGGDSMQHSSDITRNLVNYNPDELPPENSSFLERSFVCRFRCLLDNSSGFLALNFQGRLKYLHGQSVMGEDGSRAPPQLAMFTIATPVQTPSILEIRSKTLIFQTKHKLDFTPMGIDTRGKVVLGYSEIELCMRGSGYQFIHAADMMHCADNHVRMIKTGESGLTVFRLLTKTGGWVWVQANAKLIYKGGRPDFIIARQRALVNAEGEEHLRQRKMQLPFSFATGEAVLYETGPTLDATEFQNSGMPPKIPKTVDPKEVDPSSLLGSLLKQDESLYTQQVEPPLPVDQAFMDSHALVSVPSDPWQALGSRGISMEPLGVKEDDASMAAMIGALGKMVRDSGLCSTLEELDMDPAELMDWESALLRLSQGAADGDSTPELHDIVTDDIFSYVEEVLFKENKFTNSNQVEPYMNASSPEKQQILFPMLNGFNNQSPNNRPASLARQGPNQAFISTQRLTHFGPQVPKPDLNIPTLQQLQLNDIFTPSVELPGLPESSGHGGRFCAQELVQPLGRFQVMPGQVCSGQPDQHGSPNDMQATMVANRQLQNSGGHTNLVAPGLPSMMHCNGFTSPLIESSGLSAPFPTACIQGGAPFQSTKTQQWPQNQQQKLSQNGLMQDGYKLPPGCLSQPSDPQRLPPAGPWPNNTSGLYHSQQGGGLAQGQPAPSASSNSCMFENCLPPLQNGNHIDGTVQDPSLSLCQRRTDAPQDYSPPQGSCYFQWGHSEPVVGTSAIAQENARISPQTRSVVPSMATAEDLLAMQQYLSINGQTQNLSQPLDSTGLFSIPLVDGNMHFTNHSQTHYCDI
ncbi:aryl hydrocarbon receptor-like [Osmerus mordax]|uniref:aryl hydrocarbon receptor-like n=1 Tax=Osmerus mordax TaxID=8014 RepID=UPI00350F1CF4